MQNISFKGAVRVYTPEGKGHSFVQSAYYESMQDAKGNGHMQIKDNEVAVRFYESDVNAGREKKFLETLNSKPDINYCYLKNDDFKYTDGKFPEAEHFEKANIWTA